MNTANAYYRVLQSVFRLKGSRLTRRVIAALVAAVGIFASRALVETAALPPIGAAVDVAAASKQGVSAPVLKLALGAVACASSTGAVPPPRTLTLIDYSRPSVQPRLWVFDLG